MSYNYQEKKKRTTGEKITAYSCYSCSDVTQHVLTWIKWIKLSVPQTLIPKNMLVLGDCCGIRAIKHLCYYQKHYGCVIMKK